MPANTTATPKGHTQLDRLIDTSLSQVDAIPKHYESNRQVAAHLRGQGWTLQAIGNHLGITRQGVAQLLKSEALAALPVIKLEQASRTLAELAESTRQALAETFEVGARRARRRISQVDDLDDDQAAKVVLETAKIATEGAAKVHGWGDQAGAGGKVMIGLISQLKPAQVVEAQVIEQAGEAPVKGPAQ